jgi:hypothetical protein
MGASHRVVTVFVSEISDLDVRRVEVAVADELRRRGPGSLPSALGDEGELMVAARAVNGAFLGDERNIVHVYRATDIRPGGFARGRSLQVIPQAGAELEIRPNDQVG